MFGLLVLTWVIASKDFKKIRKGINLMWYCVPNYSMKCRIYPNKEQQKIIDLFRLYSSAPKYNKIKQKTVEFDIFNLFREEYEPWTLPQDLDN